MTSTIGIPIKLLNEAQVRHPSDPPIPLHTKAEGTQLTMRNTTTGPHRHPGNHLGPDLPGQADRRCATQFPSLHSYLPKQLLTKDENTAEDNMNVQLKDITVTARDGRVSHLEQVYIRGSHVRFFIVPDMLRCVSLLPLPSPPLPGLKKEWNGMDAG
jgi:hypothetical protein